MRYCVADLTDFDSVDHATRKIAMTFRIPIVMLHVVLIVLGLACCGSGFRPRFGMREWESERSPARVPTMVRVDQALMSMNATLCSVDDAAVLSEFYNATSGDGWTNKGGWLASVDCCQWYVIACTVQGRVSRIRLGRNNLSGPLPLHIGKLSFLEEL